MCIYIYVHIFICIYTYTIFIQNTMHMPTSMHSYCRSLRSPALEVSGRVAGADHGARGRAAATGRAASLGTTRDTVDREPMAFKRMIWYIAPAFWLLILIGTLMGYGICRH